MYPVPPGDSSEVLASPVDQPGRLSAYTLLTYASANAGSFHTCASLTDSRSLRSRLLWRSSFEALLQRGVHSQREAPHQRIRPDVVHFRVISPVADVVHEQEQVRTRAIEAGAAQAHDAGNPLWQVIRNGQGLPPEEGTVAQPERRSRVRRLVGGAPVPGIRAVGIIRRPP